MSERFKLQKGITLWFCGLSSSGKTTISNELIRLLDKYDIPAIEIDGEAFRSIVSPDLDFNENDRIKGSQRNAEISNYLNKYRIITIVASINHTEEQRKIARKTHLQGNVFIVWINTPIQECIKRDVKGLYQKAINGDLQNMVGISIPFHDPHDFDLRIDTMHTSKEDAAVKILEFLCKQNVITKK